MKALSIRSYLTKLLFSLFFLSLSGLTLALDNGLGSDAINPDPAGFSLTDTASSDADSDGVGNNADTDGVHDAGSWVQLGADISGENNSDLGGRVTVSANGTIIAIGAIGNDENAMDSGRVRVYASDGGAWLQRGQSFYGQVELERIGFSPSLYSDGSFLACGDDIKGALWGSHQLGLSL